MKLARSRGLLTDLLDGRQPDEADLKAFVKDVPKEDQWFDYKSGSLLEDSKAKDKIRQSISGFANTEGGFLVIGYDEKTKKFDGAKAPGGGDLTEWAVRVCGTLRALPTPRFVRVYVEGFEILLIATDRSIPLIPVVEDGETVYYGRSGDQTLRLSPSFVTDLLIGRRAQPELHLRVISAALVSAIDDSINPNVKIGRVGLTFAIENTGLVHANDIRVGIISWGPARAADAPNDALLRHLEVEQPPPYEPGLGDWVLGHVRSRRYPAEGSREGVALDIGPLSEYPSEWMRDWSLRVFPNHLAISSASKEPTVRAHRRGRVRLHAAAYIIGRDFEPCWFQITAEYDSTITNMKADQRVACFTVMPTYRDRPKIALEFLQTNE